MSFKTTHICYARETSMLKSNFDVVGDVLLFGVGGAMLFKISENVLESKRVKMSRKRPALCMLIFIRLANNAYNAQGI